MPLPLQDYVKQVLLENDRASQIYRAVHRAWNASTEEYPQRARWLRKSTFRGIVWEAAVRELASISNVDPDFRLVEHRDTASFILEDAVLFRFKHADVTLATANYPTPEASSFDSHDIDLYGFVGLQRVELCYVLNEFETSIIWVGISARFDKTHLWKIELSDSGILAPFAELPLNEEVESDTARLAKIKKSKPEQDNIKKKENGGQ